jgi:hypothetical protein
MGNNSLPNRYWVDLRISHVAVIDGHILKHGLNPCLSENLDSVVGIWSEEWDEKGQHYYLPLEYQTKAIKLCNELNNNWKMETK